MDKTLLRDAMERIVRRQAEAEARRTRVLTILASHIGSYNAIGMGELYEAVFDRPWTDRISDTRALRKVVTDLRAEGVPNYSEDDCNTPLVLSFGEALVFTPTPALAADFDIHGGPGVCTRADWPSAATPWLALDRDRNGSIDGGHELFGSGTRTAAGTGSANGFAALAELDSDGDGKLSPADARWSEIVLWADHDGDRRSSSWETLGLASFEVVEIELSYDSRRECDSAGNCGVERARFVYRTLGRTQIGEVIDVHLACE